MQHKKLENMKYEPNNTHIPLWVPLNMCFMFDYTLILGVHNRSQTKRCTYLKCLSKADVWIRYVKT